MYNAICISKQLNISKVTAYAKMKLPEVKPFVILENGKSCVNEEGLEAIKQSLKYNNVFDEAENIEIELLKDDMILSLKNNVLSLENNIKCLKEQLDIKDTQIQKVNKLLENNQIIFKHDQEKNKAILALPAIINDRDILLVNSLTKAMEKRKEKYKIELHQQILQNKKGFFSKLFKKKNEYSY